ncbi:oxidoreductase, partial [Candidatus Pelagibacter bacterium]|nr:oxidoreductase [Candidatus Pelagibacter bacterium]
MEKKATFFFFGFGQSARYFLRELSKSKKKFNFFSTNTSKTRNIYFNKKKYKSFKFKDDNYDKSLIQSLAKSEYILVSIPPQGKNDVVLKKFSKNLKSLKFKKLIYLSATSVYGNHNGNWVYENSKLKGKTKLGTRRIAAENKWKSFRDKFHHDINILRVSGIYSKESNVIKKIKKKKIYVKEQKFFSRIRVEDLAIIIKKIFFSQKKSMILNASDDKPATNKEVAFFVAKLLKIKHLKPVSILNFKNKMIKE